ncbi:MAG: hypothetical protein M1814_000907 [Vezdaea aestivalis]|nr:MAG: hypothetical protein M1814_000907 [Vezdaea aestivalis]
MASDDGYAIIDCVEPAGELLMSQVKASSIISRLSSVQALKGEIGYWHYPADNDACRRLLFHGFDPRKSDFFQQRGIVLEDETVNGPVDIFSFYSNEKQLPRLRAGPGKVILFRPIEKEIGTENGLFRIVPDSHKMSYIESVKVQSESIRIKPNQILLLDGNMLIEYPKEGGGLGLLWSTNKGGS